MQNCRIANCRTRALVVAIGIDALVPEFGDQYQYQYQYQKIFEFSTGTSTSTAQILIVSVPVPVQQILNKNAPKFEFMREISFLEKN